MLASWVQQCSFEPPQVSVAVRRNRDFLAWLTPGAAFALNQIGDGQNAFLSHFGKGFALDQPAFTGLNVDRPAGEGPVLLDAFATLYAFPRIITCMEEGLAAGQTLPNLADLLQEKCEKLLEQVCMPVQS